MNPLYWQLQFRGLLVQPVLLPDYIQMSGEGEGGAKREQQQAELHSCERCTKFFTNRQAYETHLKMKHEEDEREGGQGEAEDEGEEEVSQEAPRDSKKQGKNLPIRSRMLEIQRNQLQDNIYTFLGELGEKNAQPVAGRADITSLAADQKLAGQTNYSVNKVIRTPYEEPIKCSEEVSVDDFAGSSHVEFLVILQKELGILEQRVEAERETWQLRDPMAPEEEVADEFSLMDIRKMIQNYPRRKITLEYPHFSIFLLWLGRIAKAPAFKEFYLILGEYLAEYYKIQENKSKGEEAYERWRAFHKAFQAKKIQGGALERLRIFDQRSCRKFIDYFVQWADLFKALNI